MYFFLSHEYIRLYTNHYLPSPSDVNPLRIICNLLLLIPHIPSWRDQGQRFVREAKNWRCIYSVRRNTPPSHVRCQIPQFRL